MFEFLRRVLEGAGRGPWARPFVTVPAPVFDGRSGRVPVPPPDTTLRGLGAGDLGMLPYAVLLLLDDDAALARRAADGMAQLAASLPVERLARVDPSGRAGELRDRWFVMGTWTDDGSRVRTLPDEVDTGVLGLLSLHGSGHVRQAAVERLAPRGAGALPWLLLRANDWVAPVREAAEAALRPRLVPADEGAWVAALPVVASVARAGRRDSAFARDLLAFLRDPAVAPAVLAALPALWPRDRQAARWAFSALAEGSVLSVDALVEAGGRAPDAPTRHRAVSLLAAADDDALRHASWLAYDSSARVRGEYLRTAAERLGPDAAPELYAALRERSANLRALAVFHLRRWGGFDAAAYYRAAAAVPDLAVRTVGALRGLAEHGAAQDAFLALVYTLDPRARVRAAAVEAYGALARPVDRAIARGFLDDRSPRVRRAARRLSALAARGR